MLGHPPPCRGIGPALRSAGVSTAASTALPLAAAGGAALCYGFGTILQDVGAQRVDRAAHLDPRLLLRLARQPPYLVGLGIDFFGWLLSLVALRELPLFAVQAAVSASVGVTAVAAAVFLEEQMTREQRVAVVVLLVGLVLLGVSAQQEGPGHISEAGRVLLLAGVPVTLLAGIAVARTATRTTGAWLAAVSGVAFGGTAIAARVLVWPEHLVELLRDPIAWSLVAYGAIGLLTFGTALQHGPVTVATASAFTAETVVPAVLGVLFLGDRARPGTAPLAIVGFVAALGAVVVLSLRQPVAEPASAR